MQNLFPGRQWGEGRTGIVERERMRRIKLAVWAYAYEFQARSLVTDHVYDAQSYMVNPAISTGNAQLDIFFQFGFQPDTGQWIYSHPELKKVEKLYEQHYAKLRDYGDEPSVRRAGLHRDIPNAYNAWKQSCGAVEW